MDTPADLSWCTLHCPPHLVQAVVHQNQLHVMINSSRVWLYRNCWMLHGCDISQRTRFRFHKVSTCFFRLRCFSCIEAIWWSSAVAHWLWKLWLLSWRGGPGWARLGQVPTSSVRLNVWSKVLGWGWSRLVAWLLGHILVISKSHQQNAALVIRGRRDRRRLDVIVKMWLLRNLFEGR